MSQNQASPLKQFYRQETVYVKLPSRGNFYKEGIVDLNEDSEVAIMPMTANDEITLKNPEALLTGTAMVNVIGSCVPAVKQPRKLLACDIDVLMIAIRQASYGDEAGMTLRCPNEECKTTNDYNLDLDILLNKTEVLEDSYDVVLPDGLTVFLRPGTFETVVKQNKAIFENSKIQKAMSNAALSDEAAMSMIAKVFGTLTKLNFDVIENAIEKIVFTDETGEEQTITNRTHIKEFISNIPKKHVDLIDEKISEVNKIGIAKTLDATCTSCGHKWEAPIEFNPVNFS